MQPLPASQTLGRPRLGFIDAARALAMLLMLQGHVCDTLLASAGKATAFYQDYWFLRGLTAPLFFLLSGFAVVIASDSKWDEYRRPGPRLYKRLRRAGTLMLIGYALQMPRWSNGAPFTFSGDEWRYVLRSGVLHCVAWSIVAAHILLAVTKTRRAFEFAAFAVAISTLALTPWLSNSTFALPVPLALLLRAREGSLFPLFPFIAHFFLGATLARLYYDWAPLRRSPRRLAAVLAVAGAAMAAASYIWLALDPTVLELRARFPAADLSLFLNRTGFAWIVFALLALAVGVARSPAWMRSVSSNALSVYVLHLVVLYGLPGVSGVITYLGATLSLPQAFAGGPLLLAFCAAVMAGWDRFWDAAEPRLIHTARRVLPAPVRTAIRRVVPAGFMPSPSAGASPAVGSAEAR